MISGSLIFSSEKSVGMKTLSHFICMESHWMGLRVASDGPAGDIGWACGSGQMGPRVASDGPGRVASDAVGPRIGSRRMGPRMASDGPAGRVGWACGWHRMGPRVASDGPTGRIG